MIDKLLENLPPEMRRAEDVSRRRWAKVTAAVFLTCYEGNPDYLFAIVCSGVDKWLGHARVWLEGHAFHDDDFRRIFAVFEMRSRQLWPQYYPGRFPEGKDERMAFLASLDRAEAAYSASQVSTDVPLLVVPGESGKQES